MSSQNINEKEVEQEATQEIPILQVDTEQTVEERYTDNAIDNILPARYLVKNEQGEVVESPAELYERVAENVAEAEFEFAEEQNITSEEASDRFTDWKHEFEELMKTQRFMPNSPTLMNAGARLQQLSACISGDTPIYTSDGLKRMKNVSEGDEVLTHTGSFKEVTQHWSNGVKETNELKRGRASGEQYDAVMTPDHKVLTENGEWVRSDSIDSAKQPFVDPEVSFPDTIDLTQYTAVMGKDKPVVSDGGVLKVRNGDDPRTGRYDQQYSEVTSTVENNEQLAYLMGAYLAEGDIDGSDTRFTIGADEESFKEKITTAATELFNVSVSVSNSSYGEWQTISISSPFISDMFLSLFGTGSTEKRIPKWVFAASESYQESLLDGLLDGDGYFDGSGYKLTLANPTLAYEASLLARNIGKGVGFTFNGENALSANRTSRVRISESDNHRMDEISRRKSDTVEVFDMEVEDDHSFVAGDFIVHNCFVNSPQDDLYDIAETEKEWTLVQKTGGGMGGDFSKLRPKGELISTTKGTSSGPVSFMQKYNMVAGVIKQGGVRRGAQMAELRVDHPDIGRFAVSKRKEGALDNFNISASVTDEFVEAVREDETYTLYAPQSEFTEPYTITEAIAKFYSTEYKDYPAGEGPGMVKDNIWRDHASEMEAWDWENKTSTSFEDKWHQHFVDAAESGRFEEGENMALPARFIWDMILDGAWRNGEPGLFYLDETNRKHSFDVDEHPEYEIFATNPCAEQPLCEYEACNLGHINLSLMLEEGAPTYDEWMDSVDYEYTTEQAAAYDYFEEAVDFENLDRTIRAGTRFLDNVVTQSEFPLEEIEDTVSSMRKIGLGVMGWAQMCYQMGVRYGSEESLQLARVVMGYIDEKATKTSHELAQERGCFDAWEDSKYADPTEYSDWFMNHAYEMPTSWEDGYEMRNHNVTTVAPTGTTSMLGDTSGGIEPVYSVAYKKNVGGDIQGDEMLVEFDKVFMETLRANEADLDHSVQEIAQIAADQMDNNEFDGVQGLPVPEWMKDTFVTTQDLPAKEHGLMQRAFQEAVDSGISKTVNLPKEATHKDVHDAYMLALSDDELGAPIKGLTVYRDQSRGKQVLTTQEHSDKDIEQAVSMLEELSDYAVVTEDDTPEAVSPEEALEMLPAENSLSAFETEEPEGDD